MINDFNWIFILNLVIRDNIFSLNFLRNFLQYHSHMVVSVGLNVLFSKKYLIFKVNIEVFNQCLVNSEQLLLLN